MDVYTPCVFVIYIIYVGSFTGTFIYSITNWDGISVSYEMVGLKNYVRLFTEDAAFRNSLGASFMFVGGYTILVNLIALGLALLLNLISKKIKSIIRSIIFMPNVVSLIMVSFIWQFMFTKVYDELTVVNGGLLPDVTWFSKGSTAMVTIIITLLWQSVGYFMVIYIAGIESIDKTYYEAAMIDGAGYWQRTCRITLPLILPSITVNIFLAISGAFKTFEIPYLMTRGGPGNSTNLIAYNIYREAYMSNHAGYASAKAVILCLIVMFIAFFQIRAMKRKEVEV
ncbi:MAG TPA: ABC transporter permease [Clostridiales bacterium]|nr:ABC transporter permease [Clostridiales bacterium]